MNEHYNYPSSNTSTSWKELHYSPNLLNTIDNAIFNGKVATIEYDSFEKGVTKREIEPIALIFKDKRRQLVAWCRLRKDYRSFRLDRLNCIRLTNEKFEKREGFDIDEFTKNSNENMKGELEGIN